MTYFAFGAYDITTFFFSPPTCMPLLDLTQKEPFPQCSSFTTARLLHDTANHCCSARNDDDEMLGGISLSPKKKSLYSLESDPSSERESHSPRLRGSPSYLGAKVWVGVIIPCDFFRIIPCFTCSLMKYGVCKHEQVLYNKEIILSKISIP